MISFQSIIIIKVDNEFSKWLYRSRYLANITLYKADGQPSMLHELSEITAENR